MTEEKHTDREFVEFIAKLLVEHPEDVRVERRVDEMGVLITLDVNSADMGMVIGRDGATAKALRTLLRVIGARHNARVNLKINEPEGREPRQFRRDSSLMSTPPKPEEEKKSVDEVVDEIRL
jgi:predicted RNA-binding protein YlqC (UPF0109 family)